MVSVCLTENPPGKLMYMSFTIKRPVSKSVTQVVKVSSI